MTNETKHTPGKMWQVYERYPNSYAIVNCDEDGVRTDIAWLGQSSDRSDKENLANARLIACAPELLEALEELIDGGIIDAMEGDIRDMSAMFNRIQQLIARTKGEKA